VESLSAIYVCSLSATRYSSIAKSKNSGVVVVGALTVSDIDSITIDFFSKTRDENFFLSSLSFSKVFSSSLMCFSPTT